MNKKLFEGLKGRIKLFAGRFSSVFLRFRKVILTVVFLVGVGLVVYPFAPGAYFRLRQIFVKKSVTVPYETVLPLENISNNPEEVEQLAKPIPEENRVVIPKIGVDVEIVEGSGEWALNKGAWHRPGTGDPVKGGNFVVTGHRFRYVPPNNTTFYNLDKLAADDIIIVYWEGTEYDYKVSETFVVQPTQIEVEAPTTEPVLTMYTCTPLWTSSQRLVIRALPLKLN